jgi:acyl carrier protein
MSDDMISKLSTYIASEILKQPGRELAPDAKLITSGLIDSFSLMDIALFAEDTFSVRIEDTELNAETFDTIQELAELIKSRQ